MFGLPSWLLVIPVLGFLIFVHELGHFLTAKWFGIKVTEFGFGFPPRAFGIRYGETIYSINWIPLGGFVKMVGEEDPATREGEFTVAIDEKHTDKPVRLSIRNTGKNNNEGSVSVTFRPSGADTDQSTDAVQTSSSPTPVVITARNPINADFDIATDDVFTLDVAVQVPGEIVVDLRSDVSGHGLFVTVESVSTNGTSNEVLLDEDLTDPRSFASQSVLKRSIVLSAGSFMNLLTPFIIFIVLFMTPQDALIGSVVINGVAPGSPAEESGLRSGDVIVAVDGDNIDNHADLIQRISAKLGSELELTVKRGSPITGLSQSPEFASQDVLKLTPRLNPPDLTVVENVTDPTTQVSLEDARKYNPEIQISEVMTQGAVGVLIGTANQRVVKRTHNLFEAVPMSLGRMRDVVLISKNGINRWAAGGPDPGLSGPIGIARVTGAVAEIGISPLFEFIALISISLGIVNILPIPALDGGRLMFVLIEWVRRGKRIPPNQEGIVHLVGFVLLISLIVVISYFDIVRLINGESLFR